jgi:plasmid stability protein
MAQLVIRNLNEEIKQRLKQRALLHGSSMEAEARQILRNALKDEKHHAVALGSKIAARFADIGFAEPISEIHQQISPAALK